MRSQGRTAAAESIALAGMLLAGTGCGGGRHPGLHADLSRVLAQDQVLARANDLFLCTDRRDWPCVKDVFAPEVLFDMTSLAGGQPAVLKGEEIASAWEKGLKDLAAVHHQTGNHKVAVSGSEADVFCYGIAYHYLPNPTGRNTRVFVGSYDLHLVLSGASWKIDRFKFNLKFVDGNEQLEGPAPKH
jgi:hypothetical protein